MSEWIINLNHSSAAFKVRHMMVSWVPGLFNRMVGRLSFDPHEIAAAKLVLEIDASSIYTGVAQRDQHLQSADFLDVARFPQITFSSTRVEPAGLDQAWVYGNLTLRGVTQPVLLDTRWTGPVFFNDEGKIYTSFGFQAETRINREDFGMTWNTEMDFGGFMVGKHVYLTLRAEVDLVAE